MTRRPAIALIIAACLFSAAFLWIAGCRDHPAGNPATVPAQPAPAAGTSDVGSSDVTAEGNDPDQQPNRQPLLEPFTIAVLPDTQKYSAEGEPGFAKQVEWLLANAAAMNIVFVTHLGDVVDDSSDEEQWAHAMDALDPLLDQEWLPFSIVRGNHDHPDDFLRHLPVTSMNRKPWFVDASPSGLCQAQRFKVGEVWFLHIGFGKSPTDEELDWANRLLQRPSFRGMPVIISTHDYLWRLGRTWTGRSIWNKFVKDNAQVFMVLSGHVHDEHSSVSTNSAGLPVYQLLADYQDRDFGGNGLMRLITIDAQQDLISVRTFSPHYQTQSDQGDPSVSTSYFETASNSQFEYRLDVEARLFPRLP